MRDMYIFPDERLPYSCGSCEHQGDKPNRKPDNDFYFCAKCGYEVIPFGDSLDDLQGCDLHGSGACTCSPVK